ncbi:hypothetical protein [Streptomyces sp. NPDC002324]
MSSGPARTATGVASSTTPLASKALDDRAAADGHADSGYAALIEQFHKPSA